ncbi:MAG: cytochrome c [Sedimenticola sp.]|nr:cytochrome c [Sedimenticola sp.]
MLTEKRFHRWRWTGGLLLLLCSTLIMAHSGASGVVKQRMELMKSVGKEMKTIAAMVKGEQPLDAAKVREGAALIASRSGEVEALFPRDSLMQPTEALPAIWDRWPEFSELTQRLQQEAEQLGRKAEEGDRRELLRQFAALGKVCSGCHTDFRKKQE